MSTDAGEEPSRLSPDAAFAVLGNETRMEILQILAEADEPLPFSELRERVGVSDSGQFNYHLNKLEGHFLTKSDGDYSLRQAGNRVIEAVLSGAVTKAPVIERKAIDQACHYCGSPTVEMGYREGMVGLYCPECKGTYGGTNDADKAAPPSAESRLGFLPLPPAGIQDRTPAEVVQAATIWNLAQGVTAASGVCPRCSAAIDQSWAVCEDHDASGGLCEQCNRRYALADRIRCSNCVFEMEVVFGFILISEPALRGFLIEHDMDPVAPAGRRFLEVTLDYDEEVISTDPVNARFVFTVEGDSISLTIDHEMSVVDVTGD